MRLTESQLYRCAGLVALLHKRLRVDIKINQERALLSASGLDAPDEEKERRDRFEALRIENEAFRQRVGTLEYDLEQAKRDASYWNQTNAEHAAQLRTAQSTIKALKEQGVLCEHDQAPSVCPSCKWIKTPEFSEVEIDAMKRARKIEAIKELRTRTGIGLKEAKAVIDAHYDLYQTKTQTVGGP